MSEEPIFIPSEMPPKRRRSLLSAIFVSPREPRLRAGWRLVLQVILQVIVLVVTSGVLLVIVPRVFTKPLSSFGPAELLVTQVAELVSITLSIYLARRFLDRRSFVSLGLRPGRRPAVDFTAGIAITFLMMGLIFTAERMLGWLHVDGFAWEAQAGSEVALTALLFLAVCVLVGWNEELMSRGYHLQTLGSGTTLAWGWILSSTIFGLLHLANPHADWMAAGGLVLAGLFLGYAYLRTGQLWMSIGLHTGWNFFEGVVFGFPVSGLPFYRLTHAVVSGPALWTGGAFGPEAGLIVLPALAVGFGLIRAVTNGRKTDEDGN